MNEQLHGRAVERIHCATHRFAGGRVPMGFDELVSPDPNGHRQPLRPVDTADRRLTRLVADEIALAARVDAAYASGDLTHAEDLDVALAELRDQVDALAAALDEESEGSDDGEPDDSCDLSVDELLVEAYTVYVGETYRKTLGSPADALAALRDVVFDASRGRVTADDAVLAAGRDAYEVERARRARRTRKLAA